MVRRSREKVEAETKPIEPKADYGLPTTKLKGHKTSYMRRYSQLYAMLLLPVVYFMIVFFLQGRPIV